MSPGLRGHVLGRILAVSLALALAGCSGYARPLRKADAPAPGTAVVYGRFSITLQGSIMAPFDSAIGEARLRLRCEGHEGLLIAFPEVPASEVPATKSFEVAPGRCVLAELSFRDWAGTVVGVVPTHVAAQPLELAGGKAYYIGDWRVDVQRRKDYDSRMQHSYAQWKVVDAFEDATRELRERYPRLAHLPTKDALPLPEESAHFHYESPYSNLPPPTYPMWRH